MCPPPSPSLLESLQMSVLQGGLITGSVWLQFFLLRCNQSLAYFTGGTGCFITFFNPCMKDNELLVYWLALFEDLMTFSIKICQIQKIKPVVLISICLHSKSLPSGLSLSIVPAWWHYSIVRRDWSARCDSAVCVNEWVGPSRTLQSVCLVEVMCVAQCVTWM